jgi:hypothetical protein
LPQSNKPSERLRVTPVISRKNIRITGNGADQSLYFDLSEEVAINEQIFDMLGKSALLLQTDQSIPKGEYEIPLKTSSLRTGSYIVCVASKTGGVISLPISFVH